MEALLLVAEHDGPELLRASASSAALSSIEQVAEKHLARDQ
jgi:hypothetical protein